MSAGTADATVAGLEGLVRATKLGPKEPSDCDLYADSLAQGGNLEGATAVLKQGIALDPLYACFSKDLALRYIAAGRYDEAPKTIKQQLSLYPEDSFMRKGLSMAEAGSSAASQR